MDLIELSNISFCNILNSLLIQVHTIVLHLITIIQQWNGLLNTKNIQLETGQLSVEVIVC